MIEDSALLRAGLQNRRTDNVYRRDEAVGFATTHLPTEDLFRLWESLGPNAHQLLVPSHNRGYGRDPVCRDSWTVRGLSLRCSMRLEKRLGGWRYLRVVAVETPRDQVVGIWETPPELPER